MELSSTEMGRSQGEQVGGKNRESLVKYLLLVLHITIKKLKGIKCIYEKNICMEFPNRDF